MNRSTTGKSIRQRQGSSPARGPQPGSPPGVDAVKRGDAVGSGDLRVGDEALPNRPHPRRAARLRTPGRAIAPLLHRAWHGLSKVRRSAKLAFLFNHIFLIAVTIVIVFASIVAVWRIKVNTQRRLDEERARLEKQNVILFEKKFRPAITSKQIEFWQSYQNTRDVAHFKDSYFLATDGGLVELDAAGKLRRRYSVLDGLPESDLLTLASFDAKLFIGTRASGLVSFDGERFESYRWLERSPQAISALFEDRGRLLIGTMAAGLIEFDGQQFREIKVGADHKRLGGVIHLSRNGVRLFAGTFADGLWVEEGARWSQFTVADGLPSNRIVGVIANSHNLLAASDYGLAVTSIGGLSAEAGKRSMQSSAKLFRSVAVLPSLSSIVQFGHAILLCKDGGESFALRVALSTDQDAARTAQLSPLGRPAEAAAGTRLVVLERQLWVLSSNGIRRVEAEAVEGIGNIAALSPSALGQSAPAGQTKRTENTGVSAKSTTSNLISALAVDSQGRLWAGGFRTGIDVLSPEGKRLAHLESDTSREINSLLEDPKDKTMLAATSQGLLSFDANLRVLRRWSTTDGLLSNSVMQVAQMQNAVARESDRDSRYIACATGKGLTFGLAGKLRSLTTVQGLPSNSLYAVLTQGRSLYAGTLSGLALIQDGRVVRVFKDSNSNLSTNWVTALCLVGSRLFVGTYGGGIFELTASGELVGFASGTGRAVVNPNAMWSDGARLYAGTLDGALMFDLHSQKWTRINAELPSRSVLSITGDDRYVFFGTTSGIARIERSYWDEKL